MDPDTVIWGCMADEVQMERGFLQVVWFSPVTTVPSMFYSIFLSSTIDVYNPSNLRPYITNISLSLAPPPLSLSILNFFGQLLVPR
jgi:hypothetical protein